MRNVGQQNSILVFSAHAADCFYLAGGTIAKYCQMGAAVRIVTLSFGARGHSYRAEDGLSIEGIKASKAEEVHRACTLLGVESVMNLNWEDDPLEVGREEIECLIEIIRDFKPTFILSHHLRESDWHDHRIAAMAIIAAYESAEERYRDSKHAPWQANNIFFYHSLWNAQGKDSFAGIPEPSVIMDITDVIGMKRELYQQFTTQGSTTQEWINKTIERFDGRFWPIHGIEYGEAFLQMYPDIVDAFRMREKGFRLAVR